MQNASASYLKASDIDQLLSVFSQASNFLRRLADGADLIGAVLTENKRINQSSDKGAQPLNWGSLVDDIRTREPQLAELLESAYVDRFDFPRIWIKLLSVKDHLRGMAAFQLRPYLETYTAAKYGKKFRIRVDMPD